MIDLKENDAIVRKFKTYVIEGSPIPKLRHRFNSTLNRVYDEQAIDKAKAITLLHAQKPEMYVAMPLQMVIEFFMEIPHSYTNRKRYNLIGMPHIKKPDISNMIKFYEDIANGILYEDDSQICSIIAKKIYAMEPRTEITIMPYIRGEE